MGLAGPSSKAERLRERCLGLPGASEEFPFGDEVSVFKVGGKMFALSHLDGDPLQLSVKCDPELAVQLRAAYPAIAPGYHLNKRHWNTITLDGSVPDEMVAGLDDRVTGHLAFGCADRRALASRHAASGARIPAVLPHQTEMADPVGRRYLLSTG